MTAVQTALQQNVILYDVSWESYRRLNEEHGPHGGTRFTFDEGTMQIMVMGYEHERLNRNLAMLVEVFAEEHGLDIEPAGSNTFQREDLHKGFEPDSCFYLRHPEAIRGKKRINLAVDPAPDLVIEIDITSYSLNRLPIFAAVGVPEVWRYEADALKIYRLSDGSYTQQEQSSELPGVTAEALSRLIDASQIHKRTDWLRQVRAWARGLVH
jgi:Uma2 family endonuclease